jgi:hypothetical protein
MIGRRSHDAQSFEAALHGAAPRDGEVAELVRIAESLCRDAAAVEPTRVFRDALRSRLMSEAATVLTALPPEPARRPAAGPARRAPRRRVASLAAAAVTSAGVVGIVGSSASAVPGDMLYPVKRGVETVELQLHRDGGSRGAYQLERASERLAEARTLSADGESSGLISDTLDDFSAAATDGSRRLFAEFGESGEDEAVQKVNDFAATASVELSALSAQLPPEVATSFDAAKDTVTDLAAEASSLCAGCIPADVAALVTTVTDVAREVPPATRDGDGTAPSTGQDTPTAPRASPGSPAPAPRSPAPRAPSAPVPAVPAPAVPAVPVPAAPSQTPSLTDLTDPLVGGLLGDDDQTGLVPGLLDGLLGTPPKP